LRRVEDILAVHELMALYHEACDGWDESGTHTDPDAIASLFTEDGIWDVTARTPAPRGQEAIAALATELQSIPWIVHAVVNPIVDSAGDRATARFKGILRVKLQPSGAPGWAMGRDQLDARRTPEGWRIASLSWEPMTESERYDPGRGREKEETWNTGG
jgi:hypothetical protein